MLASTSTSLFTLDPSNGNPTFRVSFPPGSSIADIEFRDDGTLFATTAFFGPEALLAVDPDTGATSTIGTFDTGDQVLALEFVGDTLYASRAAQPRGPAGPEAELVILDPSTAGVTVIGAMGYHLVEGLAYDAATGTMYGIGQPHTAGSSLGVNSMRLFTVDLATGHTTEIGDSGFFLGSLEFGPDGILYAGEGSNPLLQARLLIVDRASGQATEVGARTRGIPPLDRISGLSFVPQRGFSPSIPTLGSSATILLVGLLGLAALRRLSNARALSRAAKRG